jgi:hypothetical protein
MNRIPAFLTALLWTSASIAVAATITVVGSIACPPITPGFYVATTGSDSNAGTLASPFLTLGKCQTAMRGGSVKTCYIRAGTYTPSASGSGCVFSYNASLNLTSSDNGETWRLYPSDPVGSAIIDGQSTTGNSGSVGNGTVCGFYIEGASNITVDGLKFTRYGLSGVWADGSSNIIVTNTEVGPTTSAVYTSAGITFRNSGGSVADHNYVHDVAFMGIGSWSNTTPGSMSNTTISSNVVLNSCTFFPDSSDQTGGDCGGVYFQDVVSPITYANLSTNLNVTNNYIRDVNKASNGTGFFPSCCSVGIYSDYPSGNIHSTGNVVSGTLSACFYLNGAESDVMTGNICDMDNVGSQQIVREDQFGTGVLAMTGNVWQHNIVVLDSSGSGGGYFGGNVTPPNPMSISNNFYYNYVGTASNVSSAATGNGGTGADSSPIKGTNPQISCWIAAVAGGSPVFSSPTSFPGITGGWGPPGFVIPQTGTAPSWPHAC